MRRILLACVLALTLVGPASAAMPAPKLVGRWLVNDQTSDIDGSPDFNAFATADDPILRVRGRPDRPLLGLACDRRGVEFEVLWPDTVQFVERDLPVVMLWKLDDAPAKRASWPGVPHALILRGPSALAWARKWSLGKTLKISVPDAHGGQEATFQLDGMDQLVARVSQLNCG